MENLRILLLQARDPGDPMRDHEIKCFAERCHLAKEQIIPYDLLLGPPSIRTVRDHDALMVGGAGEYYVSRQNLPGFAGLIELFGEVISSGHPTFASCFGYQCLVHVLGGRVIYEPQREEVGTFELTLTDQGRVDDLFRLLPDRFRAQLGHKEQAILSPDGIPNLASSRRCPQQALRIPEMPIWATQFHPELDRAANQDRLRHYMDDYMPHLTARQREEAFDAFRDSPEASELLSHFIILVFG